ncbi:MULTISPECIES: thiamine pyrophosphate-dependent enzyme [Streptomyces]|uniref:Thiamine pyrophosphate-binding protein n=1 Tax=Streptomyces lycii TaxID=2654337 RepID=A0ABQ7FKP4_9ACTN|nr:MULTISPECIES: thiamine pyrophosphate-dependent enzyme [Streptomyces]KAF4409546.1 thiamine pyrophosphate-binding protein [Streptomyces lycii]PGH48094.1 thiamine pyrophosphate-binding protein [Streptomyces sp. Ru87]
MTAVTTATAAERGADREDGTDVARAVVRFLRDGLGSDRLFTVPGEAFLPLLDAAGDDGLPVVTARHEGGAAFAALADTRLTGRPAVVAVNRSPGAANACIALDAAKADPAPLLLLVGGADRGTDPVLGFQGTGMDAMLGGLAPVITPERPEDLPAALERAARVLGAPVPGPVVLVVPEDLWDLPVPGSAACAPAPATAAPGPGEARRADAAEAAARRVRSVLAAARRPVLLAGRLLRTGDTDRPGDLLDAFARAAGVPVLLGNKQQDLLDNGHPHYAGHLHLGTPAATRERLAEADAVVLLGALPDEIHLSGWYDGGAGLVTVHPEPRGPGEHLAADPPEVLARLAAAPPGGAPAADDGAGTAGDARAAGHGTERHGWLSGWRSLENRLSAPHPRPRPDGVDFTEIAAALDSRLPDDAILTLDAGNFSSWIHRHVRLRAHQRLLALAGGSMGFGVPAAVAAALRHPDRTAVAVVGDGGLLMTGNELATARAAGRFPVIIVADNGGYGTIRAHAARRGAATDCGTGLENPDLVQWARSFGLPAERVAEPYHAAPAVRRALCNPGGYLLHVRASSQAVHANFDLPSAH